MGGISERVLECCIREEGMRVSSHLWLVERFLVRLLGGEHLRRVGGVPTSLGFGKSEGFRRVGDFGEPGWGTPGSLG